VDSGTRGPRVQLGLFRCFVQDRLDVRNVVREKPHRVAPIRAEIGRSFRTQAASASAVTTSGSDVGSAVDTDSVDTSETRELDVPNARAPVAL